jgi:hypothetical protein
MQTAWINIFLFDVVKISGVETLFMHNDPKP